MTGVSRGLAVLVAPALALAAALVPEASGQVVYPLQALPEAGTAALDDSAIGAVISANRGKPPRTGEELVKTLAKLGKFAQLPVAFSSVHMESGLTNPRVVIAEVVKGLSDAEVTRPNLSGRLFLSANMERGENGGDPRVTSVEFISWNTTRRRFDFGVIDDMGGSRQPVVRVVDGGRCFVCHKNRGPILGAAPWANTTHFAVTRGLVADKLKLAESVPPGAAGLRDRIDGMRLAAPEAAAVDGAVRLGANLRLHREAFQLMNRSPGGRKAFVALLVAAAVPGAADPDDLQARAVVDAWGNDQSYLRFAADWVALSKSTNSGILADHPPFRRVQVQLNGWGPKTVQPVPPPPPGGFPSRAAALEYEARVQRIRETNEAIQKGLAKQAEVIAAYDDARAEGRRGLPSAAQPSNPRAFLPAPAKAAQKPSALVNPVLLAGVIGLTDGDCKFLSRSLSEAAKRVNKPKVTAATLAKQVFEGPEFADVLAGGSLPDRDDFKDRFAAGLDAVLTAGHGLAGGFVVSRRDYAAGPKYDPKAAAEAEAAVVPTTACLRCHDVRPSGKPRLFEPIPALAFDPFDKTGREAWVKDADRKRREAVLGRMQERLFHDKDMPPEDAPEYDRFRVKEPAAFAEVKDFLKAELERAKKK